MSEINIAGAIDKLMIFDDPEYCQKSFRSECLFLDTDKGECGLFFDDEGEKQAVFIEELTDNLGDFSQFKKCDQCKEAYRKTVNEKLFDEEKQYAPDGP